jgi:hypothetical protein
MYPSTLSSLQAAVTADVKRTKALMLLTAAFVLLSFAVYLILDVEWATKIGAEDGPFEDLTAIAFLGASIVLFRTYRRERNSWILLLSIVMFMGFGEEISWGQRMLGYTPPDFIDKESVQHETNIHNLEPLNSKNFDGTRKTGWRKLLTVNALFQVFSVGYGVVVSAGYHLFRSVRALTHRVRLPVPALSLGVFFLLSEIAVRVLPLFIHEERYSPQYTNSAGEIYECCMAVVWLCICLTLHTPLTEKDPRHST